MSRFRPVTLKLVTVMAPLESVERAATAFPLASGEKLNANEVMGSNAQMLQWVVR